MLFHIDCLVVNEGVKAVIVIIFTTFNPLGQSEAHMRQ